MPIPTPHPQHSSPTSQLMRFSIAELKQRLRQLGVDTTTIVEKRELQDLLRRHSRQPQSPLQVQVHMEVLQLPAMPAGMAGASALEAIANAQAQFAAAQAQAPAAAAASSTAFSSVLRPATIAARTPTATTSTTTRSVVRIPATVPPALPVSPAQASSPTDPPAASPAAAPASGSRRRAREPATVPEPRETRLRARRNSGA